MDLVFRIIIRYMNLSLRCVTYVSGVFGIVHLLKRIVSATGCIVVVRSRQVGHTYLIINKKNCRIILRRIRLADDDVIAV